jgi:hypothetical protein
MSFWTARVKADVDESADPTTLRRRLQRFQKRGYR